MRRARRPPPPTADRRTPLERLEAMVAEPGVARSQRTFMRIRSDLVDVPLPGPWIAAAITLRDRGTISDDTLAYFVVIFLECITERSAHTDPELCRIRDETVAIERAHGLGEDDYWLIGEGPEEWSDLNAEWDRRDHVILVAFLRGLGYEELASELERDQAGFEDRAEVGRVELWGLDPELS